MVKPGINVTFGLEYLDQIINMFNTNLDKTLT